MQKNNKSNPRWNFDLLYAFAMGWKKEKIAQKRAWGDYSPWWSFIFDWKKSIHAWIDNFIAGQHVFSPLKTYDFRDESITLWDCEDRLMLAFIHQIIKSTFKKIISPFCYHTKGTKGVQLALNATLKAVENKSFRYVIRADIKSYYASIQHSILLEQLNQNFDDPRLQHYLKNIVTIPVDHQASLSLPKKGIPYRSSLSPFFGALYLTPLDRAFEKRQGIFYARYMDDILILCETKNQFVNAKKRLNKVLTALKLKCSPHKTKRGKFNTFHFLGIHFVSTQIEPHTKPQVIVAIHPRSCRRALDKSTAMKEDAIHVAHIQRYLIRWAMWWKRAAMKELSMENLLSAWVLKAIELKHKLVWLGRGLLTLSFLPSDHRLIFQ